MIAKARQDRRGDPVAGIRREIDSFRFEFDIVA
jgi:hypothetical protein